MLKVRTSGRVAATVIQTRPGEFATQPVLPGYNPSRLTPATALLQAPAQAEALSQYLHFAHFGNGRVGNLQVFCQILLFNLESALPTQARVEIRDDQGSPLNVRLNEELVAGVKEVTIAAGGMAILETDGEGPLVQGAVTVHCDRAMGGNLVYGGSAGVAGVGTSVVLRQGFVAPMETDSARRVNTGIAVKNPADHPVTLDLELYSLSGQPLATDLAEVASGGHKALFLGDFNWTPSLDLGDFAGLVKVTSRGQEIAATVVQTRPNQFATMPVARSLISPE